MIITLHAEQITDQTSALSKLWRQSTMPVARIQDAKTAYDKLLVVETINI